MSRFEEYLQKYCKKHEVTPEEAKEHMLVREVKVYYDELEGDEMGGD